MAEMTPLIISYTTYVKIMLILKEEEGNKVLISDYLKRTHGFSFRYHNKLDYRSGLNNKQDQKMAVDFWNETSKIFFLMKFELD